MTSSGLKILIPLDGSSTSEAILPALSLLIRSHLIESTLLHIAGSPGDEKSAAIYLERVRQELEAQGVTAHVLIHSGGAAREIVEAAHAGRFDLIAMGTHGRTGMDRITLGSVAEEVLRTSRVPVLLARPHCRVGAWETMLVALDGTPGGEEILEDVVRWARALKATVHLIRVDLPNPGWGDYAVSRDTFPNPDTLSYLNRIAGDLRELGISAFAAPIQGQPGDEIARLAGTLDAGLIFMATEGRADSSPGIGNSTSAEVIGKAPCAVFVRHVSRTRGALA